MNAVIKAFFIILLLGVSTTAYSLPVPPSHDTDGKSYIYFKYTYKETLQRILIFSLSNIYISMTNCIPSCITKFQDEWENDFGGELTTEDFVNAKNASFHPNPKGGEVNDDFMDLFQGDIMKEQLAIDYDSDYRRDITTLPDRKWPKIGVIVIVPYTIPSRATKQERASVARVILEFDTKTCVR